MLIQEFYIPVESSSIHFLKTKLCVGCSRGFEIVDLESLDTQGLLDPADESLEFIKKRENLRPMSIYRIDNEFLLCYDGASIESNVLVLRQQFIYRFRLLCQQNWLAIPERLHGILGRDPDWLW
jgi:hypothetical protein